MDITIKRLTQDLFNNVFFARLIFANFTSSLLVVNSTLLAIAGLAALVGGAILLALYYLANVSQSSSGYGYQYSNYQYSRGFRSENAGNMVWNQWQVLNYVKEIFTNDSINLEMCNIYVVSCGYHWFFIGWGFTTWWNKCEKISTGTHNVIMIIMFQELLAPRFWPCCQLQVIFIPKWITMMLIARRKLSVSSWISLICLVRQYENSNMNNMNLTNRTRRYPGQVRSTMGCFMARTIWIQHCWSDQWGCYLKWWGENP